jgi:hypothetical protein
VIEDFKLQVAPCQQVAEEESLPNVINREGRYIIKHSHGVLVSFNLRKNYKKVNIILLMSKKQK